jgi:hypothetical protein
VFQGPANGSGQFVSANGQYASLSPGISFGTSDFTIDVENTLQLPDNATFTAIILWDLYLIIIDINLKSFKLNQDYYTSS